MIAAVLARLRAECGAVIKVIGGAADFQQATAAAPTDTPAAYVLQLPEAPRPGQFVGDGIQRVDASVAVVVVCRNVSDAKGAAASADIGALRDAVKSALMGWQPGTGIAPLERGRGEPMAFGNGLMWWQDAYVSYFFERAP